MSEDHRPLDALQGWMHHALVFPQHTSREEIATLLEPSSRLTAAERLAIYQRSYYQRILKCMSEQFPALCHALGDELFTDFAREYFQACPPESYTLYDLGRRFPGYLDETRPDRTNRDGHREGWIDFMVDLARFERQLFVMFDAEGHEGKPFADEDTPDTRLRLQPCFALAEYRFSVAWYYHEVQQRTDPEFPPPQQSFVALVRKDYLTHTLPLTAPHFTFLKALHSGQQVHQALEQVAQEFAIPIETVSQSWIAANGIRKRWIDAGFFATRD